RPGAGLGGIVAGTEVAVILSPVD
ncbi:MAG: hypothetical protein QOD82_6458, partial [Pseudonocardiales bacterium]|nr:hypothetical protein [Pseudonocardiales bacterium]